MKFQSHKQFEDWIKIPRETKEYNIESLQVSV